MSKIAVIYYSATGHVHKLADALAKGAVEGGAEVRLRRVAELAPEAVIRGQDAWHEHYAATVGVVEEAKLEDLEWADGFALGTPTRYGLPAAQLKEFIDQTGPLWVRGRLANKVATSFTSSANRHGGQESTLLALNNTFYHWGSLIVPPGYTNPVLYEAGGNPYGTHTLGARERQLGERRGAHRGALSGIPARTVRRATGGGRRPTGRWRIRSAGARSL
jgi:NAD(P)H dehydrogenase (quinone)